MHTKISQGNLLEKSTWNKTQAVPSETQYADFTKALAPYFPVSARFDGTRVNVILLTVINVPIFIKLAHAQHHHVNVSYNEFHPNLK